MDTMEKRRPRNLCYNSVRLWIAVVIKKESSMSRSVTQEISR